MYDVEPENWHSNTSKPRKKGTINSAHVDADHAGDTVRWRSRKVFFVYRNCALESWLSKNQGSIDTSSFVCELYAMKLCTEYICWRMYKRE